MWMFLCLFSVVSVRAVVIDDKLDSPFTTDCFKRISIGERLVIYDVTRTSEQKRVKECEEECNNFKCTFFSFGISAGGNGTCELSTRREIARRRDADYDIYQRTRYCMEGRPTGYEEGCYRRLHIGFRLNDRHIRHSLPCDTLQACQHQCSVEQQFECHGFNIRLDESGLGRGVCELTSTPTNYLNIDRDFHHDPDFDYYEKDIRNTLPNCGYTNEIVSIIPKTVGPTGTPQQSFNSPWNDRKPWTMPSTSYHPNEISNFGYTEKKVQITKPYDQAQGRSMGPLPGRLPGRLPGYVIIDADQNRNPVNRPRDHGRNMRPDFNGYHPPQPLYPNNNNNNNNYNNNYSPTWSNDQHRQVCFQREYASMKFHPEMIRESHTFHKVTDCEHMCATARFNCAGFTYRYARLPDTASNCFLTDLQPQEAYSNLMLDRDCDVYFRMPSCHRVATSPDTDCFSQWAGGSALSYEVLKLRITSTSVSECELECLRADSFICRSFSYKISHNGDNCYLSDWPVGSFTRSHLHSDHESAIYERGSFGRGCEFDHGPQNPGQGNPNNPYDTSSRGRDAWQRFTVRGWPCRQGTQCALNKDAGFWSCEVEGGDLTQWDYCCRPQHACGYSQGYSYPWCYVGEAGPNQWRPCSEHFYPDYGGNRPTPPSQPHPSSEYGPPSRWPISYLYPEPPPNETIYFHPNQNYHESPKIQFRPSPPPSYPKAIVQKLDIKETSSDVPDNTIQINPRNNFAKKIKDSESKLIFGTSSSISQNGSSPNVLEGNTFVDFRSIPYINDTVVPTKVNKTKAILDQIEKIIEKNSNCNATKENMESESSEGIGYSRGFLNESALVFLKKGVDSAMTRFWNWGQENYFSNKRKRS